jgi:UDP-N-acetylmuramyl-tripeptide synthetase
VTIQELLQKLKESNISYNLSVLSSHLLSIKIEGASLNSKFIKKNWAFFALKGENTAGWQFIDDAVKNGALVIFTEHLPQSLNPKLLATAAVIEVPDIRQNLNLFASLIYNVDIKDFYLIGVTGTNGKTTTTYLIEHILNNCGLKCAKLGTVEYSALDYKEKSILTTPDIFTIYRVLSEAKKRGCKFLAMEMSSHSIVQGRINLDNFKQSIFTNIGHDHLDYHKSFEEYLQAKLKLFKFMEPSGYSIINIDDPHSEHFIKSSIAKVLTYGKSTQATLSFSSEHLTPAGSTFLLNTRSNLAGTSQLVVNTKLIGLHNIYNILASFLCTDLLLHNPYQILKAIEHFQTPPGRLEKIQSKKFNIFIDYAHTPTAMENVLTTLKNLKEKGSKLICVFGCGGDRDRTKRPLMGAIAAKFSDVVVITSDNPRSEDPQMIIDEIKKGIPQAINKSSQPDVYEELDRKKAIKKAIELAKEGDTIAILGKGHEDYQIFKDKTIYFSDKETVLEFLS